MPAPKAFNPPAGLRIPPIQPKFGQGNGIIQPMTEEAALKAVTANETYIQQLFQRLNALGPRGQQIISDLYQDPHNLEYYRRQQRAFQSDVIDMIKNPSTSQKVISEQLMQLVTKGPLQLGTLANRIGSIEEDVRIEQANALREAQYEQNKGLAQSAAWSEATRHSQGPDGTTGKTIAAAVEFRTRKTWVGHSGLSFHKQQAVAAMTALLSGCSQAEDWPLVSCAEVDVMKQAMMQGADYETGLWFYAVTWNEKTKKWVGKTWCRNCAQWAKKITTNSPKY